MVFGKGSFLSRIDTETQEQLARHRLEEVSEKYDMDLEDVEVNYDPTLSYRILGKTKPKYDGNVEITVGPRFLDANEPEQLKTMLHEGVHFKQFKGELFEWLEEDLGTSERFAREAARSSDFYNIDELEGMTEVITDSLLPFESSTGYPYQKMRKENELESKGIDVESELSQQIDEEMDRLTENYKEVYQSLNLGDVYLESGEMNGFEYTAVIVGEEGESAVNDYLESISDLMGPGYSGNRLEPNL